MHKITQGLKEFSFTRVLQDDSLPLIPSLHVSIFRKYIFIYFYLSSII